MDTCTAGQAVGEERVTAHTLTVREVKVMHMPPKPLKVRAMKIRTESSAERHGPCQQPTVHCFKYSRKKYSEKNEVKKTEKNSEKNSEKNQ